MALRSALGGSSALALAALRIFLRSLTAAA
jgi:hypothetical protein